MTCWVGSAKDLVEVGRRVGHERGNVWMRIM